MDLRRNYSTQKQSVNAQEGSAPFDSGMGVQAMVQNGLNLI